MVLGGANGKGARRNVHYRDRKVEQEIDKLVTVTSKLLFDGSIDDIHQPAFDLILARIETVLEAKRQEFASRP
ncbi:MAG: hypothetical protein Q7V17_06170 [Afipia sp.]|nr:hypothetical protein [Afipia sp.]